jgi:hypothetical protein
MKQCSCFPWEDLSSEPRCHEGHGFNNDEVYLSTLQFVGGAKKVNLVGHTGDRRAVISLHFLNILVMK